MLGPALAAEGHEVTPIEQGDEVALAGHDAAVDFTQPDAVARNVLAALEQGVPAVIGTTGLQPDGPGTDRRDRARARPRLFLAPNFAIGAVLMMRFAAEAARVHATRGDRRAAPRHESRRAVGDGEGDRGADRRGDADPLGAAARP